jgi:hypothetical protein
VREAESAIALGHLQNGSHVFVGLKFSHIHMHRTGRIIADVSQAGVI